MNQYNRNAKLRIYYDAEFTGLNRNTTLISVGMVSDNGTTFYAEFTDYDRSQVNDWLKDHIIANLTIHPDGPPNECYFDKKYIQTRNPISSISFGHTNISQEYEYSELYNIEVKGDTKFIKKQLLEWLNTESSVSKQQMQFFTDCYAYDWVLLNDLICDYGDALNIPTNVNYIPIDLSTLLWNIGINPDVNREEFANLSNTSQKHNSLWDAQVAKVCFEKLESNKYLLGK